MTRILWNIIASITVIFAFPFICSSSTLLSEGFDDTNYGVRGWYDYSSPIIDTSIKRTGAGSLRSTWNVGQSGPTGTLGRYGFTATDRVYLSYWIRFESGWQGFGFNSPHMVYLLTDANGAWDGLAYTYTTAYLEVDGSVSGNHQPALKLQDGANVDIANVGNSLCSHGNLAVSEA